jgi:hypothetical protein
VFIQTPAAVADKRHFDPVAFGLIGEGVEELGVPPPVLVLDLVERDRAAAAVLTRDEDAVDRFVPGKTVCDMGLIARAPVAAWLRDQPSGISAEVPFVADVRAGSHDDEESRVAGKIEEPADVARGRAEIDDAPGRAVVVPADVGADAVEPHRAEPFESILPLPRMEAVVLDLAGEKDAGRIIDHHIAVV